MHPVHVTTPTGRLCRVRFVIRGGQLTVRDRRSQVLLEATVTSWVRERNGLVVMQTDVGEVHATSLGCGCGGGGACP